jgi:ketosteroid isomerase-like protein
MKRNLSPVLALLLPVLLITACNDTDTKNQTAAEAGTKSAFDLAAAKTTIETLNAEFSSYVNKSDSVSLANMYTSDGKLMGPNMPAVNGRNSIQSTFNGMFSAGPLGLKISTIEIWGNETTLAEETVFIMTDKDGKEIDKGKALVVWKMEEGKWKLHRDIWNSDNPPPPPAK